MAGGVAGASNVGETAATGSGAGSTRRSVVCGAVGGLGDVIITGAGAGLMGSALVFGAPTAWAPRRVEAAGGAGLSRVLGGCALVAAGLAGAGRMLGGARLVREPLALVGALGGAETRRLVVRGGVSGFGFSVFGASSRGGTLGRGTPRPVRLEGGPERRCGRAGGRDRVSGARAASGAVTADVLGAVGSERASDSTGAAATAVDGLFGTGAGAAGAGAFGADPAGRDGSGTGGGSSPATSYNGFQSLDPGSRIKVPEEMAPV